MASFNHRAYRICIICQNACDLKVRQLAGWCAEQYDQGMKRRMVCAAAIIGVMTAGCGTAHGTHPISHGMTPREVKNEVLARIHDWHAVSESFVLYLKEAHGPQQVDDVTLFSQNNPTSFRLDVTPTQAASYEVIDNGLNTVEYQKGTRHYSVLTASPAAWTEFQMLGVGLPQLIQSSQAESVSVKSDEVILHLKTPITSAITAQATLWFNLVTNTPSRWEAVWKGGSILEITKRVRVNPSLSNSIFSFTPPSGVKPEVALTVAGTELDQAQARVSFPIVLPPASQNLQLMNVNVSSSSHGRVVLLTYQTPNHSPVVITESQDTHFRPTAGLSLIKETLGGLTVQVGAMPNGGELGAVTLNKTLLVVEGPTSVVNSIINAWSTSASVSPSPSP
jgi:outer membrane lipoprotein-sorting protein